MKMLQRTVLFLVVALGVGCGSVQKRDARKASFQLQPFEEVTLENGLKVFFFEDDRLPRVSFQLMVGTGSNVDPMKKKGLNAMVSNMIGRETSKYSGTELAEQFAEMGTSFGSSASIEYTLFSTSGLSVYRHRLLELFSHAMMEPQFRQEEMDRIRKLALAAIKRWPDDASQFVTQVLRRELHGDHPYGVPTEGFQKDVESLRRRDVLRHYLRYFRPNNSQLAVIGKFDAEFKKKVAETMGAWKSRKLPDRAQRTDRILKPGQLVVVDKKDLRQTQIRAAQMGISRSEERFLVARAANAVLGDPGAFMSRLNSRIRDELGLSYGASSFFTDGKEPREFMISTSTKHESVAQVIREIQEVFKKFVDEGVTQDELDTAKKQMKARFPSNIETADKLAINVMMTRLWGVSDDYLKYYVDDVSELKLAEVNQFIRSFFEPDKMTFVLYTSASATKDQLAELDLPKKEISYKDF